MKLKIYILSLAMLAFIVGCDKKRDRFFDDNPTERLNTSVENSYEILRANPNGWMIKYYPSAGLEFGGYTLFANFNSAVDVRLRGDYTTTDAESMYTIYPGAGPILTFDTYNYVIHYFGLPGAYTGIGASDSGLKGDFEFLVISASADSVLLKGRKTGNDIVMLPIQSSEATTIVDSYRASVTRFHAFGAFKFEVGSEVFNASFSTAATKRALVVSGNSTVFSYRYTPTGLDFYKEFEIGDVKFKTLTYVEPTGTYTRGYFTNEANTIKLVPES